MARSVTISRRGFLKVVGLAGGGFALGMHLSAPARAEQEENPRFEPNAWVRIDRDGIAFEVARSEMGQGVMTALPMLIAEELEVGLDQVKVRFAPADPAYTNALIGQQLTGGSTSIRDAWTKLREAGAAAREMLITAAAQRWSVTAADCHAERGEVVHPASDQRLSYGELAGDAAFSPVPESVFLKEPDEWVLIGYPAPRIDTPQKVVGRARYGHDVRLNNRAVATIVRCPVFGGKLGAWDATAAKEAPGVVAVLPLDDDRLAVVAEDTWTALKARLLVQVDWDTTGQELLSSADLRAAYDARLEEPGTIVRSEGNVQQSLDDVVTRVEAVYAVPFQAHACMEPMNCTADVREDGCDVYVPTQAQTKAQRAAMEITGLPAEQVKIHTTFLGGGFGRRGETDFVADAVTLSKALKRPVQAMWTREDDIQHDFYRPATLNQLRGGIDADGRVHCWAHRIVGPSIMSRVFPGAVKDGVDHTSIEGAANLPYAIANLEVEYAMVETPVPVGFWRSVGSSQNAFVTECFFDELAAAAGKDPLALRRELLSSAPRHRAVLDLAAEMSGWGLALTNGRHRGCAVAESFGSFVAQVAEVSIDDHKRVRVHRVVCAVDCGIYINPDTVAAQMESAIVYGLTAALKSEITIESGAVLQSNFHDFELLRMDEMPAIEVHILKSDNSPGGVGEPGLPPIAPAVANAVFAATGKPVRSLPIRLESEA